LLILSVSQCIATEALKKEKTLKLLDSGFFHKSGAIIGLDLIVEVSRLRTDTPHS